jgi:hypothetical protein
MQRGVFVGTVYCFLPIDVEQPQCIGYVLYQRQHIVAKINSKVHLPLVFIIMANPSRYRHFSVNTRPQPLSGAICFFMPIGGGLMCQLNLIKRLMRCGVLRLSNMIGQCFKLLADTVSK